MTYDSLAEHLPAHAFFPAHAVLLPLYTPASSAPQRSQYHSVGRFSVPHSPHLSVLATPDAAFPPPPPAAAALGAEDSRGAVVVVVPEGVSGLLVRRLAIRDGSSSDTDLRKAISSTGLAAGSGWRGFGAGGEGSGSSAT